MAVPSRPGRHPGLWLIATLAAATLLAAVMTTRPPVPASAELARQLDHILLWRSLVLRSVAALICGAALGLAGLLLQGVLRNPIADASTLGVVSGAQLALTIATAFAPAAIVFSREGVALAGAFLAVAFVLGLSWRRGLEPLTVVLSGMVVSLLAAALSATVILAKGENRFAQRIKALAAEHGVPTVENKPVARLLFAMGKVDETIPAELYQAVAEILAVVYRTHRYYFHRLKARRLESAS